MTRNMQKRLTFIFVLGIALLALAPFERANRVTAQSILSASAPRASREARTRPPHPLEPTEELVYVGEVSRGLLRKVDVGDFRFTVNQEPTAPDTSDDNKSA